MTRSRSAGRGAPLGLAVLGVGGILVAVLPLAGIGDTGRPTAPVVASTGSATPSPSTRPTASVPATPLRTPGPTSPASPSPDPFVDLPGPRPLPKTATAGVRRVVIPAIGVDSALEKLSVDADEVLQPPVDPDLAGWFAAGPVPGDPGPAVIAGHVDAAHAPAVFYDLRELERGDVVSVSRNDGRTVRFRVDAVEQYAKDDFPTDAVYGPTPTPSLRLVTCGGTFDHARHHYRDNVVAYASIIQ